MPRELLLLATVDGSPRDSWRDQESVLVASESPHRETR